MEGHSLPLSTPGTILECNMAHSDVNPHHFQTGNYYSDYGWDGNHPTTTQSVQMSQGWNRRYRGWSPSQRTRSHHCLGQNQVYNRIFTWPTRDRNAWGQRHYDLREHVQANEYFEQNKPLKVPDMLVGVEILRDQALSPPATGPSHSGPRNTTQHHFKQEFPSQKTQNASSRITMESDQALSPPAAGPSHSGPRNTTQCHFEQEFLSQKTQNASSRITMESDQPLSPPATGLSHLVLSNMSQSYCDQEFQLQKTQDMSSWNTVGSD